MWSDIIRLISHLKRFVITTHSNPDLDALGCELALDEFLRGLDKQVTILNSDPVPQAHRFLDRGRRIRTYQPRRHHQVIQQAEAVFVLDTSGGWKRLGAIGEVLAAAPAVKVRIDHHPDLPRFADCEVVDSDAVATGELIFDLIVQAGTAINRTMADALYAAILTDSGCFRYPKTSPKTHWIAARLLECGVNPAEIYDVIYNQYPLGRLRLQGHVLDTLRVGADGRMVWGALDLATLKAYGVRPADLDNFAGLGMQAVGVQVCVLCVEVSNREVKVSLRSDGSIAVNDLASKWGGGGHASAAGATIEGSYSEVSSRVVADVEALVNGQRAD
jgi:bifunctional oligoribonuclease and PAP phosphatase NrnA